MIFRNGGNSGTFEMILAKNQKEEWEKLGIKITSLMEESREVLLLFRYNVAKRDYQHPLFEILKKMHIKWRDLNSYCSTGSGLYVGTIHATKGLEFPIVFLYDVDVSFKRQWRFSNCSFFRDPKSWFVGNAGEFIHLRQVEEIGSETFREYLDATYCKEPEGSSTLMQNMRRLYDGFIAEKWRLYYVALTRAKDHIFHSFGSMGGKAPTWGNEFRERVKAFWLSNDESYVEMFDEPPDPLPTARTQIDLAFEKHLSVEGINQSFLPSSIDPTHVYDLLLCPRRYEYTTLKRARGMQCHEAGHSDFSINFGDTLHKMLELYDYETHDYTLAMAYLDELKYLKEDDQILLKNALEQYPSFIRQFIQSQKLETTEVLIEKAIQTKITINGSLIVLRGIIDLVFHSENGIRILDVKSNYAEIYATDSENKRLDKNFIQQHHRYQLLTYKMMLEQLGFDIEDIFIASLSKTSKTQVKWTLVPITDGEDLKEKLQTCLPFKMTQDGLEQNITSYCRVCEFRHLCK